MGTEKKDLPHETSQGFWNTLSQDCYNWPWPFDLTFGRTRVQKMLIGNFFWFRLFFSFSFFSFSATFKVAPFQLSRVPLNKSKNDDAGGSNAYVQLRLKLGQTTLYQKKTKHFSPPSLSTLPHQFTAVDPDLWPEKIFSANITSNIIVTV